MNEETGPIDRDGDRLWFGKTFYDGEGMSGVGGFGYYDVSTSALTTFSPPELRDFSVSALHVTPDAVWLSLVSRGEWGDSAGGLLRFDKSTAEVKRFALPDVVADINSFNGNIVMATDFGIAVTDGDKIHRYFVDRTSGGALVTVEALSYTAQQ
jgi:streptogramin lyase